MKRSLPADAFELRANKVKKVGIFRAWFMDGLFNHDVGNLILHKLLKIRLEKAWKDGKIQLFTSRFDDDSYFMVSMHLPKPTWQSGGASGVFNFWHGFLKDVYLAKQKCEINHIMTIQSCYYWSLARDRVTHWESYHKGGFIVNKDFVTHEDTSGAALVAGKQFNLYLDDAIAEDGEVIDEGMINEGTIGEDLNDEFIIEDN